MTRTLLMFVLLLAGGCGKATPPTQIGRFPPVADRPNVNAHVAPSIHVGEEHAASQDYMSPSKAQRGVPRKPSTNTAASAAGDALWATLGEYEITAYCPCARCCGKWADHITADGTDTRTCADRIVAAPRDIPFGTILYVEGLGKVVVHDRGGAIRGKRLDLYFPTHQAALEWGRVTRRVWRLGELR